MSNMHNKIQSLLITYNVDCYQEGKNLVYLGRSTPEGSDVKMVDFGLTEPYDNPESLKAIPVVSVFSLTPKEIGRGDIDGFLDWLVQNGIGKKIYNKKG